MIANDKLGLKKGDYMILLIVLILVVLMLLVIAKTEQGNQVCITSNGETATYLLLENQRIVITNNEDGESPKSNSFVMNTVVIQNGQVYMENATCPDQVCVKHKTISKNGEMIICLPNEVFVEIENNEDSEIDN